jgi:hypothetical protein
MVATLVGLRQVGSERRTAAQWSAGSHAFSVEHSIECLINGLPFSSSPIDKTSQCERHRGHFCLVRCAQSDRLYAIALAASISHSDVPTLTTRRTEKEGKCVSFDAMHPAI